MQVHRMDGGAREPPCASTRIPRGVGGTPVFLAEHRKVCLTQPVYSGAVLRDPALLELVFEHLAVGRASSRPALRTLALVCKEWRDAALSEHFWRPIVLELMPEVAANPPESFRSAYVRKLRGERRRRAWWPAFHPDITLSIAIYRQADRSPLYLSHGKVVFTHTIDPDVTAIKGTGGRRTAHPLSARSLGDFSDLEEAIMAGGSQLCVRVSAYDPRSGREALLFSSTGSFADRWVEELHGGVAPGTVLINESWTTVSLPELFTTLPMLSVFYLTPLESNSDTQGADRQYQVPMTDAAFMLQFRTRDTELVKDFIMCTLYCC